jgi:hypothetical protein
MPGGKGANFPSPQYKLGDNLAERLRMQVSTPGAWLGFGPAIAVRRWVSH